MKVHELKGHVAANAAYFRQCADTARAGADAAAKRGNATEAARLYGMHEGLAEAARTFETLSASS